MNLTDNEIIKAYEQCIVHRFCSKKCAYFNTKSCKDTMVRDVNDLINRLTEQNEGLQEEVAIKTDMLNRQKAEISDLTYKLMGVMHSVDKWLEGEELKQDEVNRAATMREKTLRITERQKAEIDKLNIAFDVCKKEYDDMFEIAKNQKAEIERLQKEGLQINEIFMDFVNKQKMEAIKEFAERLKELWGKYDGYTFEIKFNNLVKEMAGD